MNKVDKQLLPPRFISNYHWNGKENQRKNERTKDGMEKENQIMLIIAWFMINVYSMEYLGNVLRKHVPWWKEGIKIVGFIEEI